MPVVSLLFAAGERPRLRAIAALADAGAGFSIGLTAPDGHAGCVELVANGLAFDLAGLAPERGAGQPSVVPGVGLPSGLEGEPVEALTLQPGPHLAGAAGMMPVLRTLATVAARLTLLPGVRAVAWQPSGHWSKVDDFRSAMARWIDGGDVPAFALAMPVDGRQAEGSRA